jgi:glycerol kinase
MQADSGIRIRELRVDGGATVNNLLMQFQADLIGTRVVRPRITETTALGAAYLAGLAVGYWKGVTELEHQWQLDRAFTPEMSPEKIHELVHGWNRAVKATVAWADDTITTHNNHNNHNTQQSQQ